MSNIFGYISRSGVPVRTGLADDMMQALSGWHPDVARHSSLFTPHSSFPVGVFGSLLLHTTAESLNETLPYTDPDSGMTITADARIDNRDELSPVLGLTDNVQTPDSLYILRAYQKWDNDCGKYLLGDYAFAIWDSRKQELFCARDHIGARALFYYADRDKFIFATEPKGILASGEAPTQLTEDWIANILVGVYPAKDQAPFEQMKKLPPAHYLLVTPEKIYLEQYWDLDVTREIHYKREQDYYDNMRALIEQAIRRCTRSAFPVGAELSGGLDSSGIAAFAHAELKKRGEELSTFSHVLPDWALGKIYPFEDERQYINSLCDYTGITRKHFITAEGKGILDEFRLCKERFGYPTGYAFPVFCDALYEKAQNEGIRILLSGFPGDELVTSYGAKFFNEMIHHHRYHILWRELYVYNNRKFIKTGYSLIGRLLLHYIPNLYMLIKGNSTKTNWRDNMLHCCVATDEYIKKMHLREHLFEVTKEPIMHSVKQYERMRINQAFVCNRLEQCDIYALYSGLEYRNPFTDRNLLEYVLALPVNIRIYNGVKRYPYRMTLKGIVPENIRWRNNKMGATISPYILRIMIDSKRICDLLNSPIAIWQGLVDVEKMKNIKLILDNRRKEDFVYPQSFYSALMLI